MANEHFNDVFNQFIDAYSKAKTSVKLTIAKTDKTPTDVLQWIVDNEKDSVIVKTARESLTARGSNVSKTPIVETKVEPIQQNPTKQDIKTNGIRIPYKLAVNNVYAQEIEDVVQCLTNNLSIKIQTDKAIYYYVIAIIRDKLKGKKPIKLITEDPKKVDKKDVGALVNLGNTSATANIISNLREALMSRAEEKNKAKASNQDYNEPVFLFNHFDFINSTQLSDAMKDTIALLTADPTIVICGLYDKTISENSGSLDPLINREIPMFGIPKNSLQDVLTDEEKKQFGNTQLFKYVSNMNPVQFRKVIDSTNEKSTLDDIRKFSKNGNIEFPNVKFEDIGGYDAVRKQIKEKVMRFIGTKLFPKGIIFHGPSGTGKSFWAKAIATEMEASIQIVGASDLKSSLFGETEAAIRRVFAEARKNSPAVIVFDEFDSIAGQRGNGVNSNITNAIVGQILTEMDGFKSNTDILVIATTNFLENVDKAMLRPGRFTYKLHIDNPNKDDRRAIVGVWNAKQKLNLTEDAVSYFVERTEPEANEGKPVSCDTVKCYCDEIERHRILNDFAADKQITESDLITVFEEAMI